MLISHELIVSNADFAQNWIPHLCLIIGKSAGRLIETQWNYHWDEPLFKDQCYRQYQFCGKSIVGLIELWTSKQQQCIFAITVWANGSTPMYFGPTFLDQRIFEVAGEGSSTTIQTAAIERNLGSMAYQILLVSDGGVASLLNSTISFNIPVEVRQVYWSILRRHLLPRTDKDEEDMSSVRSRLVMSHRCPSGSVNRNSTGFTSWQ